MSEYNEKNLLVLFTLLTFTLSGCSEDESKLTVTYILNDQQIAQEEYGIGSIPIEYNFEINEGNHFMGWYVDEELSIKYEFNQQLIGDITLYGKEINIFSAIKDHLIENGEYSDSKTESEDVVRYSIMINDSSAQLTSLVLEIDNFINKEVLVLNFGSTLIDGYIYKQTIIWFSEDEYLNDTAHILSSLTDNTYWYGFESNDYSFETGNFTILSYFDEYTETINSDLDTVATQNILTLLSKIDDYLNHELGFKLFE